MNLPNRTGSLSKLPFVVFLAFLSILAPTCEAGMASFPINRDQIILNGSSTSTFSQNGILFNSLLRQGANSIVTVNNLSESCSRDVNRLLEQISILVGNNTSNDTTLENWALQMLDAWAKPPEGILSGHVNALGDFDECLGIRAPIRDNPKINQFQGKYCIAYVIPQSSTSQSEVGKTAKPTQSGERSLENLMKILAITGNAELPVIPSVGTCLPSTCSDQDVLEITRAVLASANLIPVTTFCSVDENANLGAGAIATISILVILIVLVIVGTVVELALNHEHIPDNFRQTKLSAVLLSFSIISNGTKLFNTETGASDVSCLHGIRFLSASWVVLGHTYLMSVMQSMFNLVDVYSMITTNLSMTVILNGAIVVDVFFVIGGFLVSITLISMLEKSRGRLNVPLLYLHRYLRITPLYMIIICVGTFIFPLLGSGPYWHIAKTWSGFCKRNWWKNALYINNLPIYNTLKDPNDAPCHGIAWYLGVDMQLFLVSPFLLFPVWKWERHGKLPLILITVSFAILPGLLTYINNYLPTSVPFKSRESNYSQDAYTPTYMRAAPYLIGMCTGLLFSSNRRKNLQLTKLQVVGAWAIAFATGFTVLLAPHKFYNPEYKFKPLESAFYTSGSRTAWSLAISWMIFACGTGYGGWINQFLSWKPFVPLGRLTFAIYLVSFYLQLLFHLQYRQPIFVSNYHMVNLYFAHLVMSCLVALVCTLLIEAPFMQLLKLVMPTGRRNNVTNSTDPIVNNANTENASQESSRQNSC